MAVFKQHAFALVMLSGLLVRLILLPFPGTEDMDHCRKWAAKAVRSGLLEMYSQTDTDVVTYFILLSQHIHPHPLFTTMTDLGPIFHDPDHPPGMMLMLDASEWLSNSPVLI